jgi:hypothetical protein
MKTAMSNKLTKAMCVSLILLGLSPSVFAYPPDNAAVLYYSTFIHLENNLSNETSKILSDLARGESKPNDKSREILKKNRFAIDTIVTAADLFECDWGIDYSRGFDTMIPGLSTAKKTAYLLIADARILDEQGDYKLALQRCLTAQKMGRHISDKTIISNLVGIAIDAIAYKCTQDILSHISSNAKTLNWLKNELIELEKTPLSPKPAIEAEGEVIRTYMHMEKKEEKIATIREICGGEIDDATKSALDQLRNADEQYFKKARAYNKKIFSNIIAAMDMPYPQAYAKISKLCEMPAQDMERTPHATLTAILAPALTKIYSLDIRRRTQANAMLSAVDIYIINAKAGKLPDAIPAGSPRDLFGGKDFVYEKTKDGFILRCQGKELPKDKIHEYEFKVAK